MGIRGIAVILGVHRDWLAGLMSVAAGLSAATLILRLMRLG